MDNFRQGVCFIEKILVVDDEEKIRQIIRKYGEFEGYEVLEARDGMEADEFKIFQVIYNLINNAVNYTGSDKRVLVRQLVKEQTVRIEVLV